MGHTCSYSVTTNCLVPTSKLFLFAEFSEEQATLYTMLHIIKPNDYVKPEAVVVLHVLPTLSSLDLLLEIFPALSLRDEVSHLASQFTGEKCVTCSPCPDCNTSLV